MLTQKEYWFWICNINGIGYQKITDLITYFGEPSEVFTAKEEQLMQIGSLEERDIAYLKNRHKEDEVKKYYELLEKEQIKFYLPTDEAYPSRLKHIFDPPYAIYAKGKLPEEDRLSVAIIGARQCTNYGKEVALFFAKQLAQQGIQVISGLATGIDGYGHMGALEGNGYTLGILGCGINKVYPESNYRLYEQLEQQGGILSEYGQNVLPKAFHFPRRNRLIAGMSDAILVVEARERSGSFITVDQGLEQGKDIFVIPGRITDELSIGCNRLVKMGAEIVCHPNDIIEHYHIGTNVIEHKQRQKKHFSEIQKKILGVLSVSPIHISHIVEALHIEMGIAMENLLWLELEGEIKQVTRNYYAITLS